MPEQSAQRLFIFAKLYSLNEYRNEHYFKLNGLKKEWAEQVYDAVREYNIQPVESCEIDFHFYFKDRKKRDLDNYAATVKMILDGLKLCEIISDDNWQIVRSIALWASVQKSEGVEITIRSKTNE